MSFSALYNTDTRIWVNYFRSYPERDMTFLDGHVVYNREALARFKDNGEAMRAINAAREIAASEAITDKATRNAKGMP